MDNYELLTDVGWLLESIETKKFFSRGKTDFSFGPYQETSGLFELLIDAPRIQNKIVRSYVKVQEVLANVGGFIKAIMMSMNLIMKGYSDFILLNRIQAVFEQEEIRIRHKNANKIKKNNLVLQNHKESGEDLKIDEGKFKTGIQVTKMKEINVSVLAYLKYFFGNCCKKRNELDFQEYYKYLDFKHAFAEIIRIKEQLNELDSVKQNVEEMI